MSRTAEEAVRQAQKQRKQHLLDKAFKVVVGDQLRKAKAKNRGVVGKQDVCTLLFSSKIAYDRYCRWNLLSRCLNLCSVHKFLQLELSMIIISYRGR